MPAGCARLTKVDKCKHGMLLRKAELTRSLVACYGPGGEADGNSYIGDEQGVR